MRMKAAHPSMKTKPVNVSLPAAEVAEAKSYGLNLSQIAAQGLRAALDVERKRRYLEENREAIEQYNAYVDTHGTPIIPIWRRKGD